MMDRIISRCRPGKRLWMVLASALVLWSWGLALAADKPYQGRYPYRAAATVGMVADIVQAVAGDKAGDEPDHRRLRGPPCVQLPPAGTWPLLLKSDVVFYSGLAAGRADGRHASQDRQVGGRSAR
jgi:hypothetical protein